MNFFSAQQSARRSTVFLGILFIVAIIMLLALSNLFLFEYLYFSNTSSFTLSIAQLATVYDRNLMLMLSTALFAFIVIASLYKLMTLLSGGSAIAQSLGGVVIPRNSKHPQQRKILNIVEEMALASGIPVPQVYLLNEQGINAFAAGWKISNAVIGITQGALEKLTRDELQGVIAHEFSHIFNGDMKINIRLIAILHSILMIGLMGHFALRSLRYSASTSSRKSNGGQAIVFILVVGVIMTIIGYTGTFFGHWIKSLISKQREYLADASAVQFTRNSAGIANALKKIGGTPYGSQILYASAEEYSHGYFALSDLSSSFFSFATHPPLKHRIKRIQPNWNGHFIIPNKKAPANKKAAAKDNPTSPPKSQLGTAAIISDIAINVALNNLGSIGTINHKTLDIAQQWQQNIPDFVRLYAEEPSDARLLMFALLLNDKESDDKESDDKENIAKNQLSIIESYQAKASKEVKWLAQQIKAIGLANDINIIDMALPSLQLMSLTQFNCFKNVIKKLIQADKKIDLKEWAIQRMLMQHLKTHFALRKKPLQQYFVLGSARKSIETVLSLLSHIEHKNKPDDAENSFNHAKKAINAYAFKAIDIKEITLKSLNQAIDQIEQLKPPLKQKFLTAAIHCIAHDGEIKKQSYELLRAIASCIETPLAPIYSVIKA